MTFFRTLALLCALLPFGAAAQGQPPTLPPMPEAPARGFTLDRTPEGVVHCTRQTMPEHRLRCYDELAQLVIERMRQASVRNRFAWMSRETGSSERGDRALTIAMAAGAARVSWDGNADSNAFFLTVVCHPARSALDFYIAFPSRVSDAPVRATFYRTRSSDPVEILLQPSSSGAALGLWGERGTRNFLRLMSGAEGVVFDLPLSGGRRAMLEFDITGFDQAFSPLEAGCRLRD